VARALAATVGYNVFGLSAMIILRFFVTAAYFIYVLAFPLSPLSKMEGLVGGREGWVRIGERRLQ
jgi:hypothetical protein